jgi:hypothetical protein
MNNTSNTEVSSAGSGVPVYQTFMNPILKALRDMGGKGAIADIDERALHDMHLSPEVAAIPHDAEVPDGYSEVEYRMAWARTYLKSAGLITNPSRGVWQLTEKGAEAGTIDEFTLSADVANRSRKITPASPAIVGDVSPVLLDRLRQRHEAMSARGEIPGEQRLEQWLAAFRQRFAPEVLAGLDGEPLLQRMHERRTKQSLMYWLEFKNDEEFPAQQFGSISGGSALKFGIYQSSETSLWMAGSSQQQKTISLDEAIARARGQRDELVAGARILGEFALDSQRIDYATLEQRLLEAAPEVGQAAWGHKYFSLIFPRLLDDYHSLDYQKFHLLKLLHFPADGRYRNAELFVRIAAELKWPITILTMVLNAVHGAPYSYWRVGTGEDREYWPTMRDESVIARSQSVRRSSPGHCSASSSTHTNFATCITLHRPNTKTQAHSFKICSLPSS